MCDPYVIKQRILLTNSAVLLDRMTLFNDKSDVSLMITYENNAAAPPHYEQYINHAKNAENFRIKHTKQKWIKLFIRRQSVCIPLQHCLPFEQCLMLLYYFLSISHHQAVNMKCKLNQTQENTMKKWLSFVSFMIESNST
jgi:hypothetical protein